jgi:hypothetical protein
MNPDVKSVSGPGSGAGPHPAALLRRAAETAASEPALQRAQGPVGPGAGPHPATLLRRAAETAASEPTQQPASEATDQGPDAS